MNNLKEILFKYWGYKEFRELQEQIIQSTLDSNDVIALMPTGGGKSICFQIPAIIKPGICIVISPLIALIKDQIEELSKKNIKASTINSYMSQREIDIVLDNCVYGKQKFLYIAPERISSEIFIARLKKMNVNLLVVDEAHCISQWGHDFRPKYLEIATLKKLIPNINIIALTATANIEVKKEIINKLELKNPKIFTKSFERSNISYFVKNTNNKLLTLQGILKKIKGSTIIYASTRKQTQGISSYLSKKGYEADYYHAGLESNIRSKKQEDWKNEKKRIIVATNSFGMGINKSNVKLVIHFNPPNTIEEYYQEAGRAGRDENEAYAILLYSQDDISTIKENIEFKFPSLDFIKKIYNLISNYLRIAIGSGEMVSYDFDLQDFVNTYKLNMKTTYNSIKILEKYGHIQLNFREEDKIMIPISPQELYKYRIDYNQFNSLLEVILRIYGGSLFSEFCKISLGWISKSANLDINKTHLLLTQLHYRKIINYIPNKNLPKLTFLNARKTNSQLNINNKELNYRKKVSLNKATSMITYLKNTHRCRSQIILEYFGEIKESKCKNCDICRFKNKLIDYKGYSKEILSCLDNGINRIDDIVYKIDPAEKENIVLTIRKLIYYGEVKYSNQHILKKI